MLATVLMARCQKTNKLYGIRVENKNDGWHFTWAFKMQDKIAGSEEYDKTNIKGNLIIDGDFPGCPYCGEINFFQCGKCKKISCHSGASGTVVCPECGNIGELSYSDDFTVNGNSL